jgi:hypothetical protein
MVTSTCGAEEDVKTHSKDNYSFYSVLSSMEGQRVIHCNMIEAFISNVMSVATGVKCERKILF